MLEIKVNKKTLLVEQKKTYFFRDAMDFLVYLENFVTMGTWHLLYNRALYVTKKEVLCYRMYESDTEYLFYTDDRWDLAIGSQVELRAQAPSNNGLMPSPILANMEVRR